MDRDTKPENVIIHRAKLFGGNAIEQVAFDAMFKGKRCRACGSGKPIIRIQTFMAIKDIKNSTVRDGVKLMVESGQFAKVPLKDGVGIRTGEVYACESHRRDAERAAAKAPSYAVVVIDRMPDPDKPMIQVAR